jgi:predicted DNA-binding transcriptional regulator YafY
LFGNLAACAALLVSSQVSQNLRVFAKLRKFCHFKEEVVQKLKFQNNSTVLMKERQNIPKTALPRIYFIDREIASGKYPNTRTLAENYETGTATISRDIEFMRDMLNAPIEYDYKRKGYYYTEKTFRLPATFTSAGDMLALGMAKTLLSLYRNTPIYAAARELMETITAPLTDDENPRWYEDRIIVPPVPAVSFPPEVWQAVCEGLRKNQILAFEYRGTWNDDYHPRRVHPWQLLFDNGAWYLYGYAVERRGARMFSLSRIRNISLLDKKFTLPKNRHYSASTHGSFLGVYTDDKKRRFRIAFYNDAALRVQERRWAADQQIEEISGGVILEFTGAQYGKVLELALASGRDALPLEPPELVEDWQANLRDMVKRAKSLKK